MDAFRGAPVRTLSTVTEAASVRFVVSAAADATFGELGAEVWYGEAAGDEDSGELMASVRPVVTLAF